MTLGSHHRPKISQQRMGGERELAPKPSPFLGVGIYSVPEASRLTRVSKGRIRRWAKGYEYQVRGQRRRSASLWTLQLPELDSEIALGFLDLMEVRFIDAFREAGVSWKSLRFAVEQAKELVRDDHPFSTKVFKTDGKTIFAEIAEQAGSLRLLDLVESQYAFRKIISPSLYKGIEFSPDNRACRWWPNGKRRGVVVDPEIAFGQPIVSRDGVPTRTLYNAFRAEGSIERVAESFLVDIRSVKEAVAFERSFAD